MSAPSKKLRDVKLPPAPGIISNLNGTKRPVHKTAAARVVRPVVKSWEGRNLNVQPAGELRRALGVLEKHEAELPSISSHAVRLLGNIRVALARNPTP